MKDGVWESRRIAIVDDADAAITAAAAVLENDGIIVFPTETVYGIAVAANSPAAINKLRTLKSRDAGKPFQFLVADITMAEKLGAMFSNAAQRLAKHFWPGPMTLVLPNRHGGEALGIRIPDHTFVLEVCRRIGQALVSSSANLAGEKPPLDAPAADVFGNAVDLLIDGGTVRGGVPSTVVRAEGDSFTILRAGGIDTSAIETVWKNNLNN